MKQGPALLVRETKERRKSSVINTRERCNGAKPDRPEPTAMSAVSRGKAPRYSVAGKSKMFASVKVSSCPTNNFAREVLFACRHFFILRD